MMRKGVEAMLFFLLRLQVLALGAIERFALRLAARAARGREGQTLVEFGIVVALVALAAMAAVKLFGTEIANMFGRLLQKITGVG